MSLKKILCDNSASTLCETGFFEDGREVLLQGRINRINICKAVVFLTLSDFYGEMQISISRNDYDKKFLDIKEKIRNGNIVEIFGTIYTTEKGIKTVRCNNIKVLAESNMDFLQFRGAKSPSIRSSVGLVLPVVEPYAHSILEIRIKLFKVLRDFLEMNNFSEIDLPFCSELIAFGENGFYRSVSGLYLRQFLVSGLNRIFGFYNQNCNVDIDVSTKKATSTLELYIAYCDSLDKGVEFFEQLLKNVICEIKSDICLDHQGTRLNFANIERVSFISELSDFFNRDILSLENYEQAVSLLKTNSIFTSSELEKIKTIEECLDFVFRTKIKPYIVSPTIVFDFPINMDPFSCEKNLGVADSFQFFIEGRQLATGYSDLTRPDDLNSMINLLNNVDLSMLEVSNAIDSLLKNMELGMPPSFKLSLNIDILSSVLANSPSWQDFELFTRNSGFEKIKRKKY